jgi:hypothetical protein
MMQKIDKFSAQMCFPELTDSIIAFGLVIVYQDCFLLVFHSNDLQGFATDTYIATKQKFPGAGAIVE